MSAAGAASPQAAAIEAIAKASDSLFQEIGATVRQLGGKRQKELQSAQEMHLARMKSYEKPVKEKSNAIYIALGIFAAIVIAAVILKK